MSCSFDKTIIQKYIDNTIEPLELIIMKEHIAVCEECSFELKLMSKLEDSLYSHFEHMPEPELLESFSLSVLDSCYEDAAGYSYKKSLAKAWEINKVIISNASRYTTYLPGSKLAVSTAKKVGTGINKAVKSYVRNSFRKMIAGAVK